MPRPKQIPPSDLPPWMISLARHIVRDCRSPGVYIIELTIPYHRKRSPTATITRLDTIRRLELARKPPAKPDNG